jgi:hypothetical protein
MRTGQIDLIEKSIVSLRVLAEAFAREINSGSAEFDLLGKSSRKSKEALLTIRVLLPKLEAVRENLNVPLESRSRCESCDDG